MQLDSGTLAAAENLLEQAGAVAVSVSDAADDPLFEPEPGTTPVWPRVEISALLTRDADAEAIADLVGAALNTQVAVRALDDAAWQSAWRQAVAPQSVGARLQLLPAESTAVAPGRLSVRLHMGLAFGTGQHPTTALCLEWLDSHVVGGDRMLDYGCGSGVLAIAALRLGAGRAWAVDNDRQALKATRDNAKLNGLADIWIGSPTEYRDTDLDLVAANILAGPLVARAEYFARQLRPGGRIVLSGILAAQRKTLEQRYADYFENFVSVERQGWFRLAAIRKSTLDRHHDSRLGRRAAP